MLTLVERFFIAGGRCGVSSTPRTLRSGSYDSSNFHDAS